MVAKVPFLILASLLFAGCAAEAEPAATSTSPTAAPPTADAVTGSISGTVVDDEQQPLAGATASIGVMEATTDATGAFTMNGVEPGEYSLFISILGYEQGAKKVAVVAGEVTSAQFVLRAISIVDAYHESFTKTGVVTGQYTVNVVANMVNNSQLDNLMCGPCQWAVEFKPAIMDAVTDLVFKPSVSAPAVNEVIVLVYNKAGAGETIATIMSHEYKPNGDTHHWSETQVKNLKGVPKARLQLHGPDPDYPGIALQQRVDIWQTWAWGAVLPEDFTMLPPK